MKNITLLQLYKLHETKLIPLIKESLYEFKQRQ